jgi:hypothetical protein
MVDQLYILIVIQANQDCVDMFYDPSQIMVMGFLLYPKVTEFIEYELVGILELFVRFINDT